LVKNTQKPSARPPRVSVVVASFRARAVLDACLAALLPQCADDDVELIVARGDDAPALDALTAAYPTVRVVPVAPGADIPRLRGAGLAAAAGELVLLTEDHCVADPHWVSVMRGYLDRPVDVIGGSMDNARTARALDCGAFFAEYGFFAASPANGSGALLLTGANVAYRRRIVDGVAASMRDGAWENVVHDRLRTAGASLRFEPQARVAQNLTYGFGAFVVDRYEHGRDYARVRLNGASLTTRLLCMAAVPLLPPVLAWRVAKTTTGSKQRTRDFVRALPFTLAFLGAWAAGELSGYLQGPAR
jgi:glycosyltransferase involved in cell wall biosynthesis